MKIFKLAPLAGVLLLATSCGDLEVDNPNEPDTERVLATPSDVIGLVGSGYNTWWLANHGFTMGAAFSVAADAHSASWGNFYMREISSEPRVALTNTPSHAYANVIEDPWYENYSVAKSANDALQAIEQGTALGNDEPLVRAFAKFLQGISHGQLALVYDRAFVFDETVTQEDVINRTVELRTYNEVMDAAIQQLETAAELAEANTFSTPESWMNGVSLSSAELAQLAHSYIARYLAGVGRTPEEREQVDWNRVMAEADLGITSDFGPMGDAAFDDGLWYDVMKSYGGTFTGWARMDLRFYGMADTDGDYQAWLALPPAQRNGFLITTPDERITAQEVPAGALKDTISGTHVIYAGACPFRLERGTYHCSSYSDGRWVEYTEVFTTKMVEFMPRELALLKAEGLMRTGNAAAAAAIINETRVPAGLPPVTAAGVPDSPDCVPHEPSTSGECGSLLRALQWEKWVETFHTGVPTEFTDARGWGWLIEGTPLQFPIPSKELQTLGLEVYTFGGVGGQSAAGNMAPTGRVSFGKVSGVSDALFRAEKHRPAGAAAARPQR